MVPSLASVSASSTASAKRDGARGKRLNERLLARGFVEAVGGRLSSGGEQLQAADDARVEGRRGRRVGRRFAGRRRFWL